MSEDGVMLTVNELDAALARSDHHGFGYAESRYLDAKRRRALDAAVIEVANELMMTADDLFAWTDSKHGRWLIDGVYGRNAPANAETVRGCLNRQVLRELGLAVRQPEVEQSDLPLGIVRLSSRDADAIADALEMLAGVDEGENTDYEDLMRLARIVREQVPSEVGS
jgi:hypothetical protein